MPERVADIGTGLRRFRRYPNYRYSGVEWLGEIPAHWTVKPLKRVATINDEVLPEATDPEHELEYVDISSVNGINGIRRTERMTFSNAPSRARRLVRKGDVIVSTVRTYLRAVAAIRNPPSNLVVSTGFAVVRPRALDSEFAAYALRSSYFVERVVVNSVGANYPAISSDTMATFAIAFPALPEQRAIAAFLDRETAKIDALVVKKERLIELLEEKRSALITQAVTGGVDPRVPMQHSGVQWLGEIPAHWRIVPSTWLFTESKKRALEGDRQLSATQRYGVIPQAEFERLEERQVVHVLQNLDQRKHVEIDDFVMSMRSFEGGLERAWARGCIRSSYVVLKPSAEVHIGFFSYLLKSSAYVQALRATSNFIRDGQDLNFGNFRLVRLPVVPFREQNTIANLLDREAARLHALAARVREVIERLTEFRIALISAAVTGKIDVREELG